MEKIVEIVVPPREIDSWEAIKERAVIKSEIPGEQIKEVDLLKRSVDARGRKPLYRLRIRVSTEIREKDDRSAIFGEFRDVSKSRKVLIVGAGPAGYFAALECLELGSKPIVLDRGKDVRRRRRDLKAIQQLGEVNPDSNYCFGEGGAGTYSDGKLYTRAKKRGDFKKVLRLLVAHGAPSDILIDAHPHIGSNKLPGIVSAIRETIERNGGEVHFDHRVTDFLIEHKKIKGVIVNDDKEFHADSVVLATGHSARDIYTLLHRHNIHLEAKPFALGVRIEHPQSLIDSIQYNMINRGDSLPASSYSLACQIGEKGVFSFCMCPGGLVVPSSTSPGEIVVNGMSLSKRNSPFANAGTVVSIEPEFLSQGKPIHPFVCMKFQAGVEQEVFKWGDGSQAAPAQRLTDFTEGKISADLPASSYIPGLLSRPVDQILPAFVASALKQAVRSFDKKMKGYFTSEAVAIATESRTSSPVRIPRDGEFLMHPDITGLFPSGEGAGYAGGIMSAAMDGQKVARAVAKYSKLNLA
jgi:uncharacterized protein